MLQYVTQELIERPKAGFAIPIGQWLRGRYDHSTKLWTVLMWQAWLEQWG